jgi:hypothetical protein
MAMSPPLPFSKIVENPIHALKQQHQEINSTSVMEFLSNTIIG